MQGLTAALAVQPRALWFVASARKAQVLRESLVAAGEDAQAVAAIRAPAGEQIGAHTPEEVALSVLAAVVAERRGRAAPGAAPKSCCGSAAKKAAAEVASEQAAVATPATAPRSSCCGG